MTPEDKNNVIAKLNDRGARMPCPRCGNQQFSLLDGYFSHQIQQSTNEIVIGGGPTVPIVAVVCTNCGFISQHALGALGMLQPPPEKK